MKILIADDSQLIRERIKESIKDIENVEIVAEAKNGTEAFDLINKLNPDFVLLDIRMPELNGIEVLKKLKMNEIKSKVCILTNYPYTQYKMKSIEAGADYFFDKSQDFEVLKSLINDLAEQSVNKISGTS